ncbi:MAG: helix-turn-helix domain-containing protein [Victivallales bacterium]|nr:helix-turn-helix domain-containing protein [Victivallales bacterium]
MESVKDDSLNTAEAAEFLDLSKRTLLRDRQKKNPEIPFKRISGMYFYSKKELREYWKASGSFQEEK